MIICCLLHFLFKETPTVTHTQNTDVIFITRYIGRHDRNTLPSFPNGNVKTIDVALQPTPDDLSHLHKLFMVSLILKFR
jgi:hypothetical protein